MTLQSRAQSRTRSSYAEMQLRMSSGHSCLEETPYKEPGVATKGSNPLFRLGSAVWGIETPSIPASRRDATWILFGKNSHTLHKSDFLFRCKDTKNCRMKSTIFLKNRTTQSTTSVEILKFCRLHCTLFYKNCRLESTIFFKNCTTQPTIFAKIDHSRGCLTFPGIG